MIPGADLAAWLADREAQARSCERFDACEQKWLLQPLVTELDRELGQAQNPDPHSLLAAARRFMDRTGELDAMMRELIATSRLDPFFRPPFHPLASDIQSSLLLYHHPDLSISLGVTEVDMLAAKKARRQGPASINFTGFFTLLRFVDAGGATLSFWEAPPIADQFVASQAGDCRMVDQRRIEDGEEIVVDGRWQSFVIEHASSDILFFQAVARAGCAPVGTEYDCDSLRFIGSSSTDEASSRMQMMVSLLRAMGREEAFPMFVQALDSPLFYTRWHVMREMLAMDAEAALPSLRRMAAGDPHPDVRAAAQQTLGLFFDQDEAAAGGAEADAGEGAIACRA